MFEPLWEQNCKLNPARLVNLENAYVEDVIVNEFSKRYKITREDPNTIIEYIIKRYNIDENALADSIVDRINQKIANIVGEVNGIH